MRSARSGQLPASSVEVAIAAGLVGAAALLGVGLLVVAGLLLTTDPGFLFVVLPFIAGGAFMAGLFITAAAVQLSAQLLRHTPGARLSAAVVGGCTFLGGLLGLTVEPVIGLAVAVYGAVLFWLMTTAAAARDLGPWIVPRQARAPRVPGWLPRSMRPAPTPPTPPTWPTSPPPTGFPPPPTGFPPPPTGFQPPPFSTGPDPSSKRQRPATWMELWREGLTRIPVSDVIALVIGLAAFVVGDAIVFLSLVRGDHGRLPLGLLLVGAAIAVHVVLERRMLARLGYA